jgi:hypothetical protein
MNAGFNHVVPRGGFGLLVTLLSVAPLVGCGGSSTGGPPEWPKGNVVFLDANNYSSSTSLTIPVVPTAPGADLNVCWDGLMKDLLCHDLVPTTSDIDNVSFLQIPNMTQAQVATSLAVGQLDENRVKVYRDFHVDQTTSTCANLSQFKLNTLILDPATDYVVDTTKPVTYMLLFATGTTPGIGSRSMMFLDPTATSTVTSVNAIDACASNVLQFDATFGQPMPIDKMDSTKWHVDWSQITHDSFNVALTTSTFSKLNSVQLGFYQGMAAADLQANFKDIELIATRQYEVAVAPGARDVDLANAKLQGGTASFTGFDQTDGVWALAVRCSKCQVPAPVFMTILQPN